MVNESKKPSAMLEGQACESASHTTIGFLIGENLRAIKNPTTDSQARPSLSA